MSKASERLERISAEEFKKRSQENPSWAKDLDRPIVVYEYVDMKNSNIEYLSRWLRFSGKDQYGESASFINCQNLNNAEGTYDGSVDFSKSGISKIGRLKVLGVDKQSWSAYFYKCNKLTKLSGEYLGPVAAADSSIKSIKNLRISKHNRDGEKIDLSCTMCSKIDEFSSQYLDGNQIVWDQHIDDDYIKKFSKSLNDHKNPIKKPIEKETSKEDYSVVEGSKRTIVKTIAQAIGADDILVKQNVPLTSPKRRGLLKVSTVLTALIALFLYKTTDELTKQVLIDPTVAAIRNTPELIVNWIDPKENISSETIWPNEFSPALERYAKSSKTEEDKIALARDTILVMGLKPEVLIIKSETSLSRTLEFNNAPTPISIIQSHSLGGTVALEATRELKTQEERDLATSAYQCLSAFEEMGNTFKKSEVEVKGLALPKYQEKEHTSTLEAAKGQGGTSQNRPKKMQIPVALGIN
jgi:hypothetical protein